MQCAVIDIGSNSIRLSVYDAEKTNFKILFKEKIMAGLASYVEDGVLSPEGIECACHSLVELKERLRLLNIQNVSVFATAVSYTHLLLVFTASVLIYCPRRKCNFQFGGIYPDYLI